MLSPYARSGNEDIPHPQPEYRQRTSHPSFNIYIHTLHGLAIMVDYRQPSPPQDPDECRDSLARIKAILVDAAEIDDTHAGHLSELFTHRTDRCVPDVVEATLRAELTTVYGAFKLRNFAVHNLGTYFLVLVVEHAVARVRKSAETGTARVQKPGWLFKIQKSDLYEVRQELQRRLNLVAEAEHPVDESRREILPTRIHGPNHPPAQREDRVGLEADMALAGFPEYGAQYFQTQHGQALTASAAERAQREDERVRKEDKRGEFEANRKRALLDASAADGPAPKRRGRPPKKAGLKALDELDQARQQYDEVIARTSELQGTHDALQGRVVDMERQLAELRAENQRLRSQIPPSSHDLPQSSQGLAAPEPILLQTGCDVSQSGPELSQSSLAVPENRPDADTSGDAAMPLVEGDDIQPPLGGITPPDTVPQDTSVGPLTVDQAKAMMFAGRPLGFTRHVAGLWKRPSAPVVEAEDTAQAAKMPEAPSVPELRPRIGYLYRKWRYYRPEGRTRVVSEDCGQELDEARARVRRRFKGKIVTDVR